MCLSFGTVPRYVCGSDCISVAAGQGGSVGGTRSTSSIPDQMWKWQQLLHRRHFFPNGISQRRNVCCNRGLDSVENLAFGSIGDMATCQQPRRCAWILGSWDYRTIIWKVDSLGDVFHSKRVEYFRFATIGSGTYTIRLSVGIVFRIPKSNAKQAIVLQGI